MSGSKGISVSPEDMNYICDFVVKEFLVGSWWESEIKRYLTNIQIICYDTHNTQYQGFYDSVKDYFGMDFVSGIEGVVNSWINTSDGLYLYAIHKEGLDSYVAEYPKEAEVKIFNSIRSELNIGKIVSEYKGKAGASFDDDEVLLQLSAAEKQLGSDLIAQADKKIKECEEKIGYNRMYNSVLSLMNAFKEFAKAFNDGASAIRDLETNVAQKRKDAGARITVQIKKPVKIKLNLKKK